jgi:hypothetical protein
MKMPLDTFTGSQGKGQFMTGEHQKTAGNLKRAGGRFTLPQKVWRNIAPTSKPAGIAMGKQLIIWVMTLGLGVLGMVSTVVSARQLDAWQQTHHEL